VPVLIGYMRVSTADQNHDLQRDALRAALPAGERDQRPLAMIS